MRFGFYHTRMALVLIDYWNKISERYNFYSKRAGIYNFGMVQLLKIKSYDTNFRTREIFENTKQNKFKTSLFLNNLKLLTLFLKPLQPLSLKFVRNAFIIDARLLIFLSFLNIFKILILKSCEKNFKLPRYRSLKFLTILF
ncbi:hypothetical protein BpHYR1_017045 [Brachionus plicatilis]|uniref:Uncharacterized protein n=1 Tax=Brachionus plicatilis TaxID=10195 RepID=A0A3M7SQR4_BRAPC|nr:hypothetical protein BpHYR1_017045 [Brachionus plicatilis]